MSKNYYNMVLTIWDQIDKAPWVNLECADTWYDPTMNFKIVNEKAHTYQRLTLDGRLMYRADDFATWDYVAGLIYQALDLLNRNSVEAGVGSVDVYREDR
jgi:hypothetical protein